MACSLLELRVAWPTWACYSISVIPLTQSCRFRLFFLSVWIFHSSSSWSVLQLWNNAVSRLTGERIIHHQPRNFSFLTLTMMHSRKKTYSKTCDIFSPKLSIGAYRMSCLKLHAVLPSRSIYCNLQGKIKIISRRVHSVYAVSAYISDDLIGCY